MGLSRWGYYLARAVGGFRRNPLPASVSVLVVALSLFLTWLFCLGLWGIYRVVPHLFSPSKAVVYLKKGLSVQETERVKKAVAGWSFVEECRYKSPEEVLEELRRRYAGWDDVFQGLDENPLPPALEVRLRVSDDMEAALRSFEEKVRSLAGVQDVLTAQAWSAETRRLMRTLMGAGVFLAGALLVSSILIVANTVRLAFYGRRDEWEVLLVVGARPSFIKMPFYLEGILQGVLGAVCAALPLWGVVRLAAEVLPPGLWAGTLDLGDAGVLLGVLILTGAGLSWLGARLALRRVVSY